MSEILQNTKQFFDAEDWAYQEAQSGLMLNFGGKNGQWRCFARIREEQGQFIFYSFAPYELTPDQFPVVSEYAMRANFGLFIGNFELNYATGTLQYRTSIDVEGEEDKLSSALMKHLVYQNVLTMDRYLPGLRAILEEGVSPEAAISRVEDGSG